MRNATGQGSTPVVGTDQENVGFGAHFALSIVRSSSPDTELTRDLTEKGPAQWMAVE